MENPNSESMNALGKNTNTLHLNDDSTTSRMTQLDIENSDHTRNGHNGIDSGMDAYYDSDMDDLPPLSTYLAGWKYWFHFAIWPAVFLLLNGVIISTLVAFDVYEYQYGKRRSNWYYYDMPMEERNDDLPYEMLKYNRTIIAVLFLVDSLLIYRAVLFLDRKVRELDMIGDVNQNEDDTNPFTTPSSTPVLKPNVHAQVSRKLDTVLGRNPQSRVSILVSILWLLFVGCGTVGLVSVADLLFAVSPKGKHVCKGKNSAGSSPSHSDTNNNNIDDDMVPDSSNYNSTSNEIPKIPDDLQEWAQRRHDAYSYTSNLVHLTNGMTFFTAADPTENKTRNEYNYMYGGTESQLVSIGVGGNLTFYKNAVNPSSFTSLSEGSPLSSSGFCCLYRPYFDRQNSRNDDYTMFQEPDVSLLCTNSSLSDKITDGVFPNVTIYAPSKPNRGYQENFDSASIMPYNQKIWIQLILGTYDERNGMFKSLMKFYTVDLDSFKLEAITEASLSPYGEFDNGPFFVGPGSPCYKWTRNIDVIVFFLVLCTACAWLMKIKNLSVGIVPGVVAVSMTLSSINHELGLAISALSATAILFGLLGCIRIPLNREKLIWAMYTLLFCVAGLIFTGRFYYYYDGFYSFERALVTITIASLIGFILNHPVLYLFGWVGGIWAIVCGIFLLVTPPYVQRNYHSGIFALGLGIIVGSGCATIGFNLTKYRVHVVYYSKRAWFAMNAAMQSNSSNHRAGRSNQAPTSATTRYAPVSHIPPGSPVNTKNRENGENDITAGLLNQDSEGRTRSH